MTFQLDFTLNGAAESVDIDPHCSLLHAIRTDLGYTGTKEGCDDSECGACMVLVDGKQVNSCSFLAAQAEDREVTTVEGLRRADSTLDPVQQGFVECGGVQCGFCPPGMIMSAKALLDENPDPSELEIREAITGNLCRCTGYVKIIKSIQRAAELKRSTSDGQD